MAVVIKKKKIKISNETKAITICQIDLDHQVNNVILLRHLFLQSYDHNAVFNSYDEMNQITVN